MRHPSLWKRIVHTVLCGCAAGLALLGLAGGRPALAQACDPDTTPPYLFLLFDTSGSMSWAPSCSAAEVTAGDCSYLCLTGDCSVPLQADHPDSKFFQLKSALHESLGASEANGIQFGFATFNQDELRARSKHWVYQAGSGGPSIPGWGVFPPSGSNDVLGRTWTCDEGAGDDEVGCLSTNPADLSDAWELARVRALAKGGQAFNQAVTFYVRTAGVTYRVRYTPVSGGVLGSSLSLKVRLDRCNNLSCSSVTAFGEPTVAFTPVSEYLVWQNGANRSQPQDGYFGQSNAADTLASNTCAGWDPNTDTASDELSGYSLRWPTVADLRGSAFDAGDVLPFDWLADHRQEIQNRLAPNQVSTPLASPDFRTSTYLNDALLTGETFLRLQDEDERPLFANGSTPIGASLRSFQTWWSAWAATASVDDPDWDCRRHAVVVITDGDETCEGDPCDVADDLLTVDGVETYVVAFDVDLGASNQLECTAANGGTTAPYLANTHDELVQALKDIFSRQSSSWPPGAGVLIHFSAMARKGPPPPPDPENGMWQGRSVARRFVSADGLTVLVGRTAEDNDVLSLKLAAPRDFWFHAAGESGSHVIVRNPEGLDRLPKETERFAASLAAGYSKARKGGRVSVHMCRAEDVSKPRGLPAGKVQIDRFKSVQVAPWRPDLAE